MRSDGRLFSVMFLFVAIALIFNLRILCIAFTLVPVLVMVICLPLCPESPKYNLIVKNKKEQAEKDLIKLRANDNVWRHGFG